MKISNSSFKQFINTATERGKFIEGEILKLISPTSESEKRYLEQAKNLHKERLKTNIRHKKLLLEKNRRIEDLIAQMTLKNEELFKQNKKLQEENEGVRSFKLEMEKLKANHTLKLSSLKIILFPIFSIIILMTSLSLNSFELDSNIITMTSSIFGVIVGTILAGVLGVEKENNSES